MNDEKNITTIGGQTLNTAVSEIRELLNKSRQNVAAP